MGTNNQPLSEEAAGRIAAQAVAEAGVLEYSAEGCRIATAIAQQAIDALAPGQWRVTVYIPDDDALRYARSVALIIKSAHEDVVRAVLHHSQHAQDLGDVLQTEVDAAQRRLWDAMGHADSFTRHIEDDGEEEADAVYRVRITNALRRTP